MPEPFATGMVTRGSTGFGATLLLLDVLFAAVFEIPAGAGLRLLGLGLGGLLVPGMGRFAPA